MNTTTIVLALAVFGASAVEMVEALTIVLAVGTTRGWRSALEGTAVAIVALTVIVAAVGVPLATLVPIDALRVIVGALLLVLGLNWLRKAILRASGHKALHDEDAIYARTVAELTGTSPWGEPSHPAASPTAWRMAAGAAGLDGFRRRVQGSLPRGARGGHDRDHARVELAAARPRRHRRGGGGRHRDRRRCPRCTAAVR